MLLKCCIDMKCLHVNYCDSRTASGKFYDKLIYVILIAIATHSRSLYINNNYCSCSWRYIFSSQVAVW